MFSFEGKNSIENKKESIPIEEYFRKFDIVILGETYHGTHTEEILSLLERSRDVIVGVLYEIPINYQRDVDMYMKTGEVTDTLAGFFEGAEGEEKNVRGLLKELDFLRLHEKTATCIDSSKVHTPEYSHRSEYGYYFHKGKSRDEDMRTMIEYTYAKNPGKYMVIVGANHIGEGKYLRTGENTLREEMLKHFAGSYISVQLTS